MMQNSSMADALREAMERKQNQPQGEGFTMMGQYTSTVQLEESPDGSVREFVMYDDGSGNEIKVYGNWNEYAVSQDAQGNMMIADEDYPIVRDERGDFVLDEATFENKMRGMEVERQAQGGPGESRTGDLLEMLSEMRGQGGQPAPGRKMAMGGRVGGGGGEADSDDALIVGGRRRYRGGGRIYKY